MSAADRLLTSLPQLEVWTDPDRMRPYRRDESTEGSANPVAVVFPRSAKEVAHCLRFARTEKLPVIPRGAGSGLSGAVVPTRPSLILSLERMNRILEVDVGDRVAIVEPGVITAEIRKAADERGLFYPPIPASVDFCSIGGNVATNAGGLCAVKYGVTREYVLALQAVLPTGEIVRTGGRYLKNTTGYNLTQLIVGSEGTLAVITEITLRLLPAPRERITMLVPFDSLEAVSQGVSDILSERIVPPTLELLPREAVACVLTLHPELSYPFPSSAASLLIELDGRTPGAVEEEAAILDQTLVSTRAGEAQIASTPAQREAVWQVRKLVRDSIVRSGDYIEADSVVPRKGVPALVRAAQNAAKSHGLGVISYGHAGDGNLHTYFRRGDLTMEKWTAASEAALREFFVETVKLGGTISGEHGIGLLKRDYLPLALSPEEIALMRRLKAAFDPDNLLNPGKIFPDAQA